MSSSSHSSSTLDTISALSAKFLSSHSHDGNLSGGGENNLNCSDVSVHHHIRIQLKEIPFFADIPDNKLEQLASMFEFRRSKENEIICHQGDEANGFGIIINGIINVSAIGPGGNDIHLNTLNEGDYFGEIALTQNTLRTATLTSSTNCLLLYLPSIKFKQFLNDAPEIRESGIFDSTITRRTANSLKSIPLFAFLGKSNRSRINNPNVRHSNHSHSNHSPSLSQINNPNNEFDDEKLNLLGELFKFQQFTRNTVIFSEGDEADAFYIIQRGTVGVYAKKGENDDRDVVNTAEILRSTALNHLNDENNHQSNYDHENNNDSDETNENDSATSNYDSSSDHSPSINNQKNKNLRNTRRSSTANYGVLLTELTKNDWFGEISLFSHTRRTATVITRTPCQMLKLFSGDFKRFMEIVPEVKPAFNRVMSLRIAQTLSNIPFFRAVKENRPWSKINVLGAMFQFEHFTANEIIIAENNFNDKFYLICDGSVEASRKMEGPQTEPIVLELLNKNNWFNENSLIETKPSLATYKCLENCLFLTVTREKFQRLIEIAPEIVDDFSALVTFRTATMLKNLDFIVQNIKEGDKPWSKLELLCSMFTYEFANSGTIIFNQGDSNEQTNKFYLIQRGSVVQTVKQIQNQNNYTTNEAALNNNNNSNNNFNDSSHNINSLESSPSPKSSHKLSIQITPSPFTATTNSNPQSHLPSQSSDPVTLRVGSYFGEISLLRHCPRPCTIVAREPCVFLTLTRAKFHQFLKVAPEIRSGLLLKFPFFTPDSPNSPNDPVSPLRIIDDEDNEGNKLNNDFNIFIQRVKEEQEFTKSSQERKSATNNYNEKLNTNNTTQQQQQSKAAAASPSLTSSSSTSSSSSSPPLIPSTSNFSSSTKFDSESKTDSNDSSRDDSVASAVRFHTDEIE